MHPASQIHTCKSGTRSAFLALRSALVTPARRPRHEPGVAANQQSHSQRHRVTGHDRPNSHQKPLSSAVLQEDGPPPNLSLADSTLPVIGTLPDHFAESATLARNSQHSDVRASESHFRATWMLQVAAVVANCNTYNRDRPVRELRKGLFFRGRRHVTGIDSTSESIRTVFQTIYT